MKNFLLIGFLILSTICYICFLLIDGTPALVGIIGIAGLLISVSLNIKFKFVEQIYFINPRSKTQYRTFFHQNGSESGSEIRPTFCALLICDKSERKDLKSLDFRSFMVAAAGLEPAASGL